MLDAHAELRNRKLSNVEWMRLSAIIPMGPNARSEIDNAIFVYRLANGFEQQKLRPAEIRNRLLRIAKAAEDFVELVRSMDEEASWLIAHPGTYSNSNENNIFSELLELTSGARLIGDWCRYAADRGERHDPLPRTFWLDHLVENIDAVLQRAAGVRARRSKAPRDFVHAVCTLADPSIGPGSIEGALKKLSKNRGNSAP